MINQERIEELAKILHKITTIVYDDCMNENCKYCKYAFFKDFITYNCIDLKIAEELINNGVLKNKV